MAKGVGVLRRKPDLKPRREQQRHPKTGNPTGTKMFEPSDAQRKRVKMLILARWTHEDIAAVIKHTHTGMPITRKMLEDHFADELNDALPNLTVGLMSDFSRKLTGANAIYDKKGKLLRDPMPSETAAQKFWLETQDAFSKKMSIQGKLNISDLDWSKLTEDEKKVFESLLERLLAR